MLDGGMRRSPPRILTWHVHGSHLYYLSQLPDLFRAPVKPGRLEGYGGRCGGRSWPANLREVDADHARDLGLGAIVFQSPGPYERDQRELLAAAPRALPRIHVEHDPPRASQTGARHIADDTAVLLVHGTHFNVLMWDNGRTPAHVIRHGVAVAPDVHYSGEIARGLVVVDDLPRRAAGWGRSRRTSCRRSWRVRFFFNPIRCTSLGLAVCEAMAAGVPVVGLATTDMPCVIRNGVSVYIYTDMEKIARGMREILARLDRAKVLGEGARRCASLHCSLKRFARDRDLALAAAQLRAPHSENRRAGGLNEQADCAYK